MRVRRMPRTIVAVSTVLLAGILSACSPSAEENTSSSPEKSSSPTAASPTKPSTGVSATGSPNPSANKSTAGGQQTPNTQQVSDKPTTEPSDPAENDPEIEQLDINLTNRSNCGAGVTVGLDKIVGWVDGPFKVYIWFLPTGGESYTEYAVIPYGVGANPMDDWHFVCAGKAPGKYSLKFVSDDVDVSPTEPVAITVPE